MLVGINTDNTQIRENGHDEDSDLISNEHSIEQIDSQERAGVINQSRVIQLIYISKSDRWVE